MGRNVKKKGQAALSAIFALIGLRRAAVRLIGAVGLMLTTAL
jgi:hypothetical protein